MTHLAVVVLFVIVHFEIAVPIAYFSDIVALAGQLDDGSVGIVAGCSRVNAEENVVFAGGVIIGTVHARTLTAVASIEAARLIKEIRNVCFSFSFRWEAVRVGDDVFVLTGPNATLSLLRAPKARMHNPHYILYDVVIRGFDICLEFRLKK